jgi:hypothetical protein
LQHRIEYGQIMWTATLAFGAWFNKRIGSIKDINEVVKAYYEANKTALEGGAV